MKNKLQIITLNITAAGQVIKIDTETDLKHKEVEGVFLNTTQGAGFGNAELKLIIDDEEILPSKFEARLLAPSVSLSYKDVAMPFKEKAKGSKVRGEYTDKTNPSLFSSYSVRIYLMTSQD